jgi:hypothetical protein
MKLFKGQIDASLIIPVLIGLLYAGTGGWSAERWNGALAIMGLGAAARGGYERGYHTYNPELRQTRCQRRLRRPRMTATDAHIIGDVVIASLLASGLRLIVMEAFIKPAAIWAGRRGWHALDWALGGRLPTLP